MEKREGIRLGELLVQQGALSEQQVQQILKQQKDSGRPFGELAETMFDVGPEAIEEAWIEQYLSYATATDLNRQRVDPDILEMLTRRQAWQFRFLPLRREDGELIAATSRDHLRRAVNFAWRRFSEPIYFLVADPDQLQDALMTHYPWPAAASLSPAG